MSEFRKAGTLENGSQVNLERRWLCSENDKYFITDKKYGEEVTEIELTEEDKSNIYEFLFINERDRLLFKNSKNGMTVIIDPMDENSRDNLSIFSVNNSDLENDTTLARKIDWVEVKGIIFDTEFFKMGHPYEVLWIGGSRGYTYSLLKTIAIDYMVFVYIDGSGASCDYVVTKKMYENRDIKKWFHTIVPEDKWADEIEKAPEGENNNGQTTVKETINIEKKPRKRSTGRGRKSTKKDVSSIDEM